jgi:hypothetical protein
VADVVDCQTVAVHVVVPIFIVGLVLVAPKFSPDIVTVAPPVVGAL